MAKYIIFLITFLSFSIFAEGNKTRFPAPFVKMAIDGIKDYPEVVDAAVNHKSNEINLVVVVREGISTAKAKEMGDNFLRC
ncbi:MAG: hypothetical protein ACPGJV_02070 [Bacteriovoracaceae bacterium]